MTDNEKLIEEARAFVASWDMKGSWSSDSPVGMVARLADALAVFEKAHTPNVRDPEKTHIPTGGVSLSAHTSTDDERARADAAEDGLFRVVQALGFDTDGAKTAGEFFGPMTYCTGEGQYTDPAGIAVGYVTDYRAEMEAEADKADETIAALRSSVVTEPSAEPKHDESCAEWCNHCQVCGEGILYGSRCRAHYQNQSEPQAEPSDAELDAGARALFDEILRESSIGDVGEVLRRCRNSAGIVLRAASAVQGENQETR